MVHKFIMVVERLSTPEQGAGESLQIRYVLCGSSVESHPGEKCQSLVLFKQATVFGYISNTETEVQESARLLACEK